MTTESSSSSPTNVAFIGQCNEYTSMLKKRETHRLETYVEGGVLKLRSVPKTGFFEGIRSLVLGDEANRPETVVKFVRQFLSSNAPTSKNAETNEAYHRLSETLIKYIENEFPKDHVFRTLFQSHTSKKQHAEHELMSRSSVKETYTDSKIQCLNEKGEVVEIPTNSEYLMLSPLFKMLVSREPPGWDKTLHLEDFSSKTVQLALHWMKYNEIPPCSLEELSQLGKLSDYLLCEGLTRAVDSAITGIPLDPTEQGKTREILRQSIEKNPQTTDCNITFRGNEGEEKEKSESSRLLHCHSFLLKRCTRIAPFMTLVRGTGKESKEKAEMGSPPHTIELNLESHSKKTVSLFLDWLYTDSLLSPCSSKQLIQLYALAESVGCASLTEYCTTQLRQIFENNPTKLCELILDGQTPPFTMKFLIQQFSFPMIPRADLFQPYFSKLQTKFSEKSDPESITALACLYINCREMMPESTLEQLEAIAHHYAPAQYVLGCINQRGGHGIAKNEEEANKFFGLSADQGYAPAQYQYALSFKTLSDEFSQKLFNSTHRKELTELPSEQIINARQTRAFEKGALYYLKLAANQGYSPAQYRLAMLYFHKGESFSKKREMSLVLLKILEEIGYAPAQYIMAQLFEGIFEHIKDENRSLELLKLGAKQGSSWCLESLLNMFRRSNDLLLQKDIIQCLDMHGLDHALLKASITEQWDTFRAKFDPANYDVLGYW